MSTAAKMKGLLGVVIDGACRDLAEHHALDFPVSPSVNHGLSSFTPRDAKGRRRTTTNACSRYLHDRTRHSVKEALLESRNNNVPSLSDPYLQSRTLRSPIQSSIRVS